MDDMEKLAESCYELLEMVIREQCVDYILPGFEERVKNDVINLLSDSEIDYSVVSDSIEFAMIMIHDHLCPSRSQGRHTITSLPHTMDYISNQLEYLKNCPQPIQRTPEWYEYRNKCLTASNIWKTFGSESSRNQLIYEKCNPSRDFSDSNTNVDSTLHKGQCYEPLSIQWYEYNCDAIVADYGAIRHKTIPFISASPDGINVNECSSSYGRMLEVKNIFNREINGIPKLEYWVQMQIQMEVCELDLCDFLETRFIEYNTSSDFETDGDFTISHDNKSKGIFIMFMDTNGRVFYQYPPYGITLKEFESWQKTTMEVYSDSEWIRNVYWKLDQVSCVAVKRNKLWFSSAYPIIEELWRTIENERITGFEHRKPKRKRKASPESFGCIIPSNDGCDDTPHENVSECIISPDDTITA